MRPLDGSLFEGAKGIRETANNATDFWRLGAWDMILHEINRTSLEKFLKYMFAKLFGPEKALIDTLTANKKPLSN